MVQELESWGVKFQKTVSGEYDVKKVHHKGSYVLPMPEGYDIEKILTRTLRRAGVNTENRVMATTDSSGRGKSGWRARLQCAQRRIRHHSGQSRHPLLRSGGPAWAPKRPVI
jgi:hypothetical protein